MNYTAALARDTAPLRWYILSCTRAKLRPPMPGAVRPEDPPKWTRAEEVAAAWLHAAGHEIYLPWVRLEGEKHSKLMFPGYLFLGMPPEAPGGLVQWASAWSGVLSTPGVRDVLRSASPGRPPHGYKPGVVEEIRKREQAGIVVIPKDPSRWDGVEAGADVQVTAGLHVGLWGTFEKMIATRDGRERLFIWLNVFGGRKVRVELPSEAAEPIA